MDPNSAFSPNATQQQQQFSFAQEQQQLPIAATHMMPLPAATPWNLDSMPWTVASKSMENPGDVMQFHAHTTVPQDPEQKRAQLHQKRKSDILPPLPAKQFISEEKITAHFNGLHISSDYIQETDASSTCPNDQRPTKTRGKTFTNLTYHDYQVTAKELEEKLKKAQRITMCEEIRKMNEQQNKAVFLPHALLNRIEEPCTALVLWQPPPILNLMQSTDPKNNAGNSYGPVYENETEIEDFVDNNNSCDLDLNNLRVDGMDTDM